MLQEQYDEALRFFQQSLLLCQQINHQQGETWAKLYIGQLLFETGHLDEATSRIQESRAFFASLQIPHGEAYAWYQLCRVYAASGNQKTVLTAMRNALHISIAGKYINFFMQFLPGIGECLLHMTASLLGIEVCAFVTHHPAAPYFAAKQAQSLLTKQERLQQEQQAFYTALEAGKQASVTTIMEKIDKFFESSSAVNYRASINRPSGTGVSRKDT